MVFELRRNYVIVLMHRAIYQQYEPLVEKGNRGLVHHMILYECASTLPILGQHARLAGAPCYGATMPREWDSCMQPVVAWARGSRGNSFYFD